MNHLVFGGASQGKSRWIQKTIAQSDLPSDAVGNYRFSDGDRGTGELPSHGESTPETKVWEEPLDPSVQEVVLHHFEDWVWQEGLFQGNVEDPLDSPTLIHKIETFLSPLQDKTVRIEMTDCGQGLVPMDPKLRLYRERCGVALQFLAEWADRVDWIVAGQAICLKEPETLR